MAVQFIKDQLWEWFSKEFVEWIKVALRGALNAFVRWLGPFAMIMLKVSVIVCAAFELTLAAISQLAFSLHELIQMELFKPDGALLTYAVFINRFVPLTETFAMAILITNIYALVIAFRWLKSLIPFWSN